MVNIIKTIRQLGDFLVKTILVLNVLGIMWWTSKFVMPLSMYLLLNRYLLYAITVGYLLLIPVLLISNFKLGNRILGSFLAILFLAAFVTASYRAETSKNEVRLGVYRFHLTEHATLTDWWGLYSLYQCNILDTGCRKIDEWEDFYKSSDLVADEKSNSVYFFESGYLKRSYNLNDKAVIEYEEGDVTRENGYVYWVRPVVKKDHTTLILSMCDEATLNSCEILQIYVAPPTTHVNILSDFSTDEISLVFDSKLTYTYSKSLRQYEYLNYVTINSLWETNAVMPARYNLSGYQQDGKYQYVLYECSLDYSICFWIPFHFSSLEKAKTELAVNGNATEILLFVDDKLVFTYGYGGVSHCYIEGCSSPERPK